MSITNADLSQALGRARARWDGLLAALAKEHPEIAPEWHRSSVKAGWSLRVKLRGRTILYMIPGEGTFQAALVFGDKALAAIRAGGFPAPVLQLLSEARKYAEGTGIRLEVKTQKDIAVVVKLAAVKVAH
jgi:hypothetical protein